MCDCDPAFAEGEIIDPFCDPKNPKKIRFEQVALAYVLIRNGVLRTPCEKAHLSQITGMNVYIKHEFKQFTGSFKERGARFTMLRMDEETRKKGVVSASAGNHAQAMCYHGLQLGVPVTVVMPVNAPLMKIQKCKLLKGNVIIEGASMKESRAYGMKIAKEMGATYVSGYDHPDVIAGQGTLGIEILEQLPEVDAIVIPVGGGSMISGVSLAVKTLKPSVKIIGVESESCASFGNAMKVGGPVFTELKATMADGLAVSTVGVNAFATARDLVDRMITVKEEDIAVAVLRLIELEKHVVEGAGATSVAAVLSGQMDEFHGKNVVLILSGGNIDTTVLHRAIDRGLAADARYVRVYVKVPDRPNGLADLCNLVSSIGVNVKNINQERAWVKMDVFTVEIKLICETRDYDHVKELKALLESQYKDARIEHADFPLSSAINQKFKFRL